MSHKCDAIDGLKDGLVENLLKFDFDPPRDLPECAGETVGAHVEKGETKRTRPICAYPNTALKTLPAALWACRF